MLSKYTKSNVDRSNRTEFTMKIVIAANEFLNQHFVSDDKQRNYKNQRIKFTMKSKINVNLPCLFLGKYNSFSFLCFICHK